jgi:hypothetical protein
LDWALSIWYVTGFIDFVFLAVLAGVFGALLIFFIPVILFILKVRILPLIESGHWKVVKVLCTIMTVIGSLCMLAPLSFLIFFLRAGNVVFDDPFWIIILVVCSLFGLPGGLQLFASWLALSSKRDYLAWAERRRSQSAPKER